MFHLSANVAATSKHNIYKFSLPNSMTSQSVILQEKDWRGEVIQDDENKSSNSMSNNNFVLFVCLNG